MNEQLQREYYNVIIDIWKTLKSKTDGPDNNGEYWEKAVADFNAIAEKYKGTVAEFLAWRMALASLAALEDIYRQQKEARDGSD